MDLVCRFCCEKEIAKAAVSARLGTDSSMDISTLEPILPSMLAPISEINIRIVTVIQPCTIVPLMLPTRRYKEPYVILVLLPPSRLRQAPLEEVPASLGKITVFSYIYSGRVFYSNVISNKVHFLFNTQQRELETGTSTGYLALEHNIHSFSKNGSLPCAYLRYI